MYAPDLALALLKGISHVAPHLHVLDLKNALFSRDPAVVSALDHDPLIPQMLYPTGTVAAMVRGTERLKEEFANITLPVLIVHGTADKVTEPSGSQRFYDSAGSKDKTLKLYQDHAHDLLADIGKEQVIAAMIVWLDARITVAPVLIAT